MNMLHFLGFSALSIIPCFGIIDLSFPVTPVSIPDNDPTGIAFTVDVQNADPTITNVSLSLETSGGFNGDLYAYLSFGSDLAVLLNRPGVSSSNAFGFSDSGFDVTFSDAEPFAPDPHTTGGSGGPVSGTFGSDARGISPLSAPADFDTAPRSISLSNFEGQNPNGIWTFFIADVSSGSVATIESVQLSIETVIPEESTIGILFGLIALGVAIRRTRSKALAS